MIDIEESIYRVDDKTLSPISDINQLLDSSGKLKEDIFSDQGSLLCKEGKEPPGKLLKRSTFYVKRNREIDPCEPVKAPPAESSVNGSPPPPKPSDAPPSLGETDKLSILEKTLGRHAVDTFQSITETMDAIWTDKLTSQTIKKAERIIEIGFGDDRFSVNSCIQTIREVDSYTLYHSLAVGLKFAMVLQGLRKHNSEDWFFDLFKSNFGKINFTEDGIKNYALGALLHDYGKTKIDQKILQKEGRLSDEELKVIKTHPMRGVEELKKMGMVDHAILSIVGNHHASYLTFDHLGQGVLATICGVVDIYDACRSRRCYKEPFTFEKTMAIIQDEKRKHGWNGRLVEAIVHDTFTRFEMELEKVT